VDDSTTEQDTYLRTHTHPHRYPHVHPQSDQQAVIEGVDNRDGNNRKSNRINIDHFHIENRSGNESTPFQPVVKTHVFDYATI
jgi:hypothetical protein